MSKPTSTVEQNIFRPHYEKPIPLIPGTTLVDFDELLKEYKETHTQVIYNPMRPISTRQFAKR